MTKNQSRTAAAFMLMQQQAQMKIRGSFSQLLSPGVSAVFSQFIGNGQLHVASSGWYKINDPMVFEEITWQAITSAVDNPLNLAKECKACHLPAEWQLKHIINGVGTQKFFCNACLKKGLSWSERFSNIRPIMNSPVEEVEYIELTRGWLGETGTDFVLKLFEFIRANNGLIQYLPDTNSYLIVDDAMTDEAVEELAERLEGHPVSARKVKIIRQKEKGK